MKAVNQLIELTFVSILEHQICDGIDIRGQCTHTGMRRQRQLAARICSVRLARRAR